MATIAMFKRLMRNIIAQEQLFDDSDSPEVEKKLYDLLSEFKAYYVKAAEKASDQSLLRNYESVWEIYNMSGALLFQCMRAVLECEINSRPHLDKSAAITSLLL